MPCRAWWIYRGRWIRGLSFSCPSSLTWPALPTALSFYHCSPLVHQISIPAEYTVQITEKLTQEPVQLIGLAARDSLRLEAGMCLYGNDLDETTSPVEAGLSWVIGTSLNAVPLFSTARRA